jgi:hypothetical protein
VPRKHDRTQRYEILPSEEGLWPLLSQLEAVAKRQVEHWGSGKFKEQVSVKDAGGDTTEETVEEALRELASSRHRIERVMLSFIEHVGIASIDRSLYLTASRSLWGEDFGLRVSVTGPDEASVIGISQILGEEVKALCPQKDEMPAASVAESVGTQTAEKSLDEKPALAEPALAEPAPETATEKPTSGPVEALATVEVSAGHRVAPRSFWHNPWVLTVGGGVAAALITAAIIAVLTSVF